LGCAILASSFRVAQGTQKWVFELEGFCS
jgi:hypothetical protein